MYIVYEIELMLLFVIIQGHKYISLQLSHVLNIYSE